MEPALYAVTISHQLGSGGAYIGEKLAGRLGIPFLDRSILQDVARQLDLAEAELEGREERLSSFWQNFARTMVLTDPSISFALQKVIPSDSDLFEMECGVIQRIAEKSSAVFLGRCGFYVLRHHPRLVRILLTANKPSRVKRLMGLFQLTEEAAFDLIKTNDRERGSYIRAFTRQSWLDARLYDLCVDTSAVGWDCAVDLAEKCIYARLQ